MKFTASMSEKKGAAKAAFDEDVKQAAIHLLRKGSVTLDVGQKKQGSFEIKLEVKDRIYSLVSFYHSDTIPDPVTVEWSNKFEEANHKFYFGFAFHLFKCLGLDDPMGMDSVGFGEFKPDERNLNHDFTYIISCQAYFLPNQNTFIHLEQYAVDVTIRRNHYIKSIKAQKKKGLLD